MNTHHVNSSERCAQDISSLSCKIVANFTTMLNSFAYDQKII